MIADLIQIAIWFPVQAVLINRILRGYWRQFPLIFGFVVAEFLVAVAQCPAEWAMIMHKTRSAMPWRTLVYERGEVFLEFFTFVVVINLIFRATAGLASHRVLRIGCVAGAILFAGASLWVHYDPQLNVGRWMAPWTRDLNVGTSVLDLALWSLLLTQRRRDDRLLLLSGALGIQFTGAAIGHSLRALATHQNPWPWIIGGKLVVITSFIRLFIWVRAFRQAPQPAASGLALDVNSGSG